MIRKRDWLWLFAFPVYLMISTIRHESAHAVIAFLQGVDIQKLVFWPSFYNENFCFGYVLWQGEITWLALAAPYLFDIITYSFVFPIVFVNTFRRHWLWLNLVIIGLISPMINSGYNYLMGSDVRRLHEALPSIIVHGCFLTGLGLGLIGLVLIFTQSKQTIKEQCHIT